jgi:hypothetical protein
MTEALGRAATASGRVQPRKEKTPSLTLSLILTETNDEQSMKHLSLIDSNDGGNGDIETCEIQLSLEGRA